jgi:hypothetical protein
MEIMDNTENKQLRHDTIPTEETKPKSELVDSNTAKTEQKDDKKMDKLKDKIKKEDIESVLGKEIERLNKIIEAKEKENKIQQTLIQKMKDVERTAIELACEDSNKELTATKKKLATSETKMAKKDDEVTQLKVAGQLKDKIFAEEIQRMAKEFSEQVVGMNYKIREQEKEITDLRTKLQAAVQDQKMTDCTKCAAQEEQKQTAQKKDLLPKSCQSIDVEDSQEKNTKIPEATAKDNDVNPGKKEETKDKTKTNKTTEDERFTKALYHEHWFMSTPEIEEDIKKKNKEYDGSRRNLMNVDFHESQNGTNTTRKKANDVSGEAKNGEGSKEKVEDAGNDNKNIQKDKEQEKDKDRDRDKRRNQPGGSNRNNRTSKPTDEDRYNRRRGENRSNQMEKPREENKEGNQKKGEPENGRTKCKTCKKEHLGTCWFDTEKRRAEKKYGIEQDRRDKKTRRSKDDTESELEEGLLTSKNVQSLIQLMKLVKGMGQQ